MFSLEPADLLAQWFPGPACWGIPFSPQARGRTGEPDKIRALSAWHLARVTPNSWLRDLGYGARSALLPVPPQLWAACLGWCWPDSPSWEMLTWQLLEGDCIWLSLPSELGPAQPFQRDSLGTVRTCLEMMNSFCSQQVFVTHMPSSALSFPSTGWQKEEQLCSWGDTHLRVAARRTSPAEQRSAT